MINKILTPREYIFSTAVGTKDFSFKAKAASFCDRLGLLKSRYIREKLFNINISKLDKNIRDVSFKMSYEEMNPEGPTLKTTWDKIFENWKISPENSTSIKTKEVVSSSHLANKSQTPAINIPKNLGTRPESNQEDDPLFELSSSEEEGYSVSSCSDDSELGFDHDLRKGNLPKNII